MCSSDLLAVIAISGAAIIWHLYETLKSEYIIDFNEYANYHQGMCSALMIAQLCGETGIEYDVSLLEEAKEIYGELLKKQTFTESTNYVVLSKCICAVKLSGGDTGEYLECLNGLYDDEAKLYKNDGCTNIANMGSNIIEAKRFLRCQIEFDERIVNRFIEYYNENIDRGDLSVSETGDLVTIVYYFIERDEGERIDLSNQNIKNIMQKNYDNYLAVKYEYPETYTSDIGYYETDRKVWRAAGIDTSELDEIARGFELTPDMGVWCKADSSLQAPVYTFTEFYEALKNSDNICEENEEFCANFGDALDTYFRDVIIPQMKSELTKVKK